MIKAAVCLPIWPASRDRQHVAYKLARTLWPTIRRSPSSALTKRFRDTEGDLKEMAKALSWRPNPGSRRAASSSARENGLSARCAPSASIRPTIAR